MAPSRRGWQQRRRRRAVRTDRPGAGCSAFTLRAGSALPLRARRASRAAPSPAGGGSGPAHGSAQAGPEARLRAAAWSRPGWSCGTRRGAGHGVGRPALPKAGGGRRAGRERAALEERDSGQEGRGARPRDGAPRPCAPATESARAAPLGTARLPEPSLASPAARSRRKLAPWDRAGCGRGRAAGRGSAAARPHSLTMPSCGFRGGGGGQAAARRERSGPSERARSCRLAACTGAGACARGARETHALTLPHTRERCEGRGGRGGQSLTTAHVYMPEGGGGALLCFSPFAALEAPLHQSPRHQLISTANYAGKEWAGGRAGVCPLERAGKGPNLPCLCPRVQPWRRVPPYPSPGLRAA